MKCNMFISIQSIQVYRETNHRNVMTLLKIFFDHAARKVWLLFDYAEYDLHAIIKYYRNINQRMPTAMAKSCLWQILLGVKYLHDNWFLHRDLVSTNIQLSHFCYVRIRISTYRFQYLLSQFSLILSRRNPKTFL